MSAFCVLLYTLCLKLLSASLFLGVMDLLLFRSDG